MCISDTRWLFLQTTSFVNRYLPAYLGLNIQCDLWRMKYHQEHRTPKQIIHLSVLWFLVTRAPWQQQ